MEISALFTALIFNIRIREWNKNWIVYISQNNRVILKDATGAKKEEGNNNGPKFHMAHATYF